MATAAERLKEYERLFKQSQSYDTNAFQNEYKKAYGEATNYNKGLIEERNRAISDAQALPAQLRDQYYSSPIRNPLAQEALIATRRGTATQDIANLQDLLAARGNRYQDVLSSALGVYQTAAQRAQTVAENQWRLYQDQLAQEEAARARAQQQAFLGSIANRLQPTPVEQEQIYEIPEPRPTVTKPVQDILASGVRGYREKEGFLPKYGELMKGTAISSLAGIPGITAYGTSVLPDVWSDIKGGVSNLWNKLRKR